MTNRNNDHPVFDDLLEIYKANDLVEMDEVHISELVIGKRKHWDQISKDDAVKILTEIQTDGIEEILEKAKNGSLHSNADSKVHLETVTDDSSATSMSHFTDEDTGEVVEITQEFVNRAHEVQGFIRGSFYLLAEGLAAMADENLYGAFGYTSFREYCQNELDFGVRQAYRYAVIGRSVSPHLQLGDGNSDTEKEKISHLDKVGTTKLNEIIKHAEDQVETLIKEGKIKIGDQELTDQDLKDRRVKELREMLKNANDKAQKAELLEEQKKNVEIEKEALEEENEELRDFKEKNKERAENQEDIEKYLKEIETKRERIVELMTRLTPEIMFQYANDEQTERLARLLTMWQQSAVRQKKMHLELIEQIDAESFELEEEEIMNTIS